MAAHACPYPRARELADAWSAALAGATFGLDAAALVGDARVRDPFAPPAARPRHAATR